MWKKILIIAAAGSFLLATFGAPSPHVALVPLGLLFLTLTFLIVEP
jgi:hypothetical protein